MHQTSSLLMEQARSSLHLPNKEASASKRCHILLSSHQQTSAQFPTVSLILFSLHRVMHLAAYMKTPQNTKNWILIVENFPNVVFVRTDKINSFIWRWHWTKFALSTFCPSYFGHLKILLTTTGVTCKTFYHYSLQKIFVNLNCCNFALSWTYEFEVWTNVLTTQVAFCGNQ